MSTAKACHSEPAVKNDYTAKGEYIVVDGLRIYHTGSSSASKAIFFVYDVFGFVPQTLQGADILAGVGTNQQEVQVFMPDILKGQYFQEEWMSPNAPPKAAKAMQSYFAGIGSPAGHVANTPKLVAALSQKYSAIQFWGGLGLCWGAKIISLTSGPGSPFKACAEAHPSFVDPKDAENVTIPMCVLASKDEDAETVEAFVDKLKSEKYFETFADQKHGFMGARADLAVERNRQEYSRGYAIVNEFLAKHL